MNAVGSVAIAVSGNNQQCGCQRQNPLQQAMQQIMQYLQGFMAGQMLGQMMHGNQNGCMCSQNQNPNFGGIQNPNANAMMAGLGMGLGMGLANQGGMPFGAQQPFGVQPFPAQQASFGNSNGLLAGMPSLGLTGLNNSNSLYNGLPGGLGGVPNPYEVGQPITGLASGLPPLAFNVLGQNPNPGFAGGNNILGLIPPVIVPPLQSAYGQTVIPAGSGLPVAFGNNLGSFLG